MPSSRRIKSILIGGLFSLFVPLGAFLYLKYSGHDGHIALPKHYGIEKVQSYIEDGKSMLDTTYHKVQDIKLTTQLGDTINPNEDFKNKILVVNFFFTSCHTICPTLTKNMKLLNKAFKKNDTSIRFISISVDPVTDSVPRLRDYADRQNPNHDKWVLCTGKKTDIYNYARKELYLELPMTDSSDNDFIHPDQFVLIDKYRNIRGYYNGLDSIDLKRCADDIPKLMLERNRLHEKSKR